MNSQYKYIKKKTIAIGPDRDAALTAILPRAVGGLRKSDLPHCDQDARISLLAERYHFRIGVQSMGHYVYLQIGYRHICSVLNIKIFSDGSGRFLDRRVSVIG